MSNLVSINGFKKISFLIVLIAAAALLLTNCGKKEKEKEAEKKVETKVAEQKAPAPKKRPLVG